MGQVRLGVTGFSFGSFYSMAVITKYDCFIIACSISIFDLLVVVLSQLCLWRSASFWEYYIYTHIYIGFPNGV